MANTGSNPMAHPLRATAQAIAGNKPETRMSHFMSMNEGPAEIAAKITGAKTGGTRMDDGAYFTNNEGHPWPDPYAYSTSDSD